MALSLGVRIVAKGDDGAIEVVGEQVVRAIVACRINEFAETLDCLRLGDAVRVHVGFQQRRHGACDLDHGLELGDAVADHVFTRQIRGAHEKRRQREHVQSTTSVRNLKPGARPRSVVICLPPAFPVPFTGAGPNVCFESPCGLCPGWPPGEMPIRAIAARCMSRRAKAVRNFRSVEAVVRDGRVCGRHHLAPGTPRLPAPDQGACPNGCRQGQGAPEKVPRSRCS